MRGTMRHRVARHKDALADCAECRVARCPRGRCDNVSHALGRAAWQLNQKSVIRDRCVRRLLTIAELGAIARCVTWHWPRVYRAKALGSRGSSGVIQMRSVLALAVTGECRTTLQI